MRFSVSVLLGTALAMSFALVRDPGPGLEIDGLLATHQTALGHVTAYQTARHALPESRLRVVSALGAGVRHASAEGHVACLGDFISSERPANPDPHDFARAILDGAHSADLDPAILAGVAGSESGYGDPNYLIGDDGKACGAFQQHPRWLLPPEERTQENIGALCEQLLDDWHFAARVAAPQLKARPVCHYNQGMRCLEGEGYTGRVMRRAEQVRRACPDLGDYRPASHSDTRWDSESASR